MVTVIGWMVILEALALLERSNALNWLDKQREERNLVVNRPASILPTSEGVHLGGGYWMGANLTENRWWF